MASISDIAPLGTTAHTGGEDVKAEITKLGKVILKTSTEGLKKTTQTVLTSVPEMISKLTKEIESGPIDRFAVHMNKLVKLVDQLGINLGDYNEKLGKTVDKFRGSQQEAEDKLFKLREKGIKAEIDQKTGGIKLLTEKEAKFIETKIERRTENIEKLETDKRELLQKNLDTKTTKGRDNREKAIIKNEDRITKLKLRNEQDKAKVDPLRTADTGGALGDQPGFGKLSELKEAFMVIPDTITEVFGGVKNIGKVIGKQFKGFLGDPMKTISKVFKNIGKIFRTFKILIALKILAIIAAFQWVVEHITGIGDVFKNIWSAVKDFFQGIVDWFKNSEVGKFFFGDKKSKEEKEKEDRSEGKGKYQSLEGEGAIDISQDAELSSRDSKDPLAPFFSKSLNTIIQPDNPAYMDIKKKEFNTSERYVGSDGKLVNIENEPKSLLAKRKVVGNNMEDGSDTSDALKMLQSEAGILDKPVVTNIQNNSNVSSQNSSGTTVSGYVDHEPDTSFKYIRNNNSDINWV